MRQRLALAALTVITLSLPGLRTSAQSEESTESSGESEGTAPAPKPAPPPPAPAPTEAEASTPPPASEAYVPFAPPPGPLRVEVPGASIQFGILAQPQFEMAGAPDADKTTKNIFLRRLRFMVGGTLFKTIEFFVQTDWPNLFKLDPSDTMAFRQERAGPEHPGRLRDVQAVRRTDQGRRRVHAAACLAQQPRERGEALRRRLLRQQLPTQRHRDRRSVHQHRAKPGRPRHRRATAGARAQRTHRLPRRRLPGPPGRYGSAVHHDVDRGRRAQRTPGGGAAADQPARRRAGIFLPGDLSRREEGPLGRGFYDFQDKYKYFGGNLFVDLPLGPGIFTAQGDVVQWDGGGFLTLPKAMVYMGELGYLIGPIMLSPIARVERLVTPLVPNPDTTMIGLIADPSNPSENRYGGGLAFWPYGHNSNLKAFFTRVHRDPGRHDFNVITAQWQVYVY